MYSLDVLLPNEQPVSCSTSSSNCCFLTYIQFLQEASQVVWYSHLFKNFPQVVVIHTAKALAQSMQQKQMFSWNSAFSDSLRPHELQHSRLPCHSPSPWCLLRFMSIKSVIPSNHLIVFHPLLLPPIFPSIRSFPMSQLFTSCYQSIGALALALVLPVNIQG